MDDDVVAFDGATSLLRAWSRGIRPDPDLTVSEWAERHRWLSSRASAEPGRYRTARTPYKRLRRGARLWTVAVSTFKAETYRFLRLARPTDEDMAAGAAFPPGSVHLPHWVENEWLKQFVAEQLVTVRTKRGFARLEWQKLRERTEALDCRVATQSVATTPHTAVGPEFSLREEGDELQHCSRTKALGLGRVIGFGPNRAVK